MHTTNEATEHGIVDEWLETLGELEVAEASATELDGASGDADAEVRDAWS